MAKNRKDKVSAVVANGGTASSDEEVTPGVHGPIPPVSGPVPGIGGKLTGSSLWLVPDLFAWTKKLIVPLIVLLIATILIPSLKWALGISAIESHLDTIRSNMVSSEDTIFTYRYDFEFPDFSVEKGILTNAGIDVQPAAYLDGKEFDQKYLRGDGGVSKDHFRLLLRARSRMLSPIKRNLYFSAATSAEVTLLYEMKCYVPGGLANAPISFSVEVNGKRVSNHQDWKGGGDLEKAISENFEAVLTRSNYALKRHTLTLKMFPSVKINQSRLGLRFGQALENNIERCSFDAMIFVRDIPQKFESDDLLKWLKTKVLS